jgi:hypothetical protein
MASIPNYYTKSIPPGPSDICHESEPSYTETGLSLTGIARFARQFASRLRGGWGIVRVFRLDDGV